MARAHVHYVVEQGQDGRCSVFAVLRARRECLGYRQTREQAEAEAEVYESLAKERRAKVVGCRLCKE